MKNFDECEAFARDVQQAIDLLREVIGEHGIDGSLAVYMYKDGGFSYKIPDSNTEVLCDGIEKPTYIHYNFNKELFPPKIQYTEEIQYMNGFQND